MWARAISSPDVGNVGQLRAILSARGANKLIRCTIHVIKSNLHVSFTEDLSYGVAIFHIIVRHLREGALPPEHPFLTPATVDAGEDASSEWIVYPTITTSANSSATMAATELKELIFHQILWIYTFFAQSTPKNVKGAGSRCNGTRTSK